MNLRIRTATATVAALAGLLTSVSCGNVVRQGRAPSFLVIDAMQAQSGAKPGTFSSTLDSDVLTIVKKTVNSISVDVPTIFEDGGQVQVRAVLKDQGVGATPLVPSEMNAITLTRYHVDFRRSDGRNVQGVDVPYSFDGGITITVGSTAGTVGFPLVRIQAKEESPLKALQGGGNRLSISTIAEVTLYGHDQAGNEVQQTGTISVNFADWGDPS